MLLGAIADDFTGATDLCSMLVRGGMRTVQLIGVPRPGDSIPDADAVVVALKSRTAPVRQQAQGHSQAASLSRPVSLPMLRLKQLRPPQRSTHPYPPEPCSGLPAAR